jgi:hypothetical protein
MIYVTLTDIPKLERDLKEFRSRAYPFVTKQTLNKTAFVAMKISQSRVRRDMTLRNKWTTKSIRFEKTNTLRVSDQVSRVGSVEAYMEDQEFGGVKRGRGRVGVPIPTGDASGEGNTRDRQRLPMKKYRVGNIRLARNKIRAKSKSQENVIKVKQAIRTKQRIVYMDLGARKGLFRIMGTKRSPKVRMIQDLSKKSVIIKPDPWLRPSMIEAGKQMPAIYLKALVFQTKRSGLFDGR